MDDPLSAEHPEIPAEHALQGFDGVRAYAAAPARSGALLEKVLSAVPAGETAWELRGDRRGATITYDAAPEERGRQSAGTVHHVAWGTTVAEHPEWHALLQSTGVPNSGIIDRHYFHSIYFREPSGVLFEIADDGPGFTVDVPLEQLGSVVILPPQLESRRREIEAPADAAARPAGRLGQDSLGVRLAAPLGPLPQKFGVIVWGLPRCPGPGAAKCCGP